MSYEIDPNQIVEASSTDPVVPKYIEIDNHLGDLGTIRRILINPDYLKTTQPKLSIPLSQEQIDSRPIISIDNKIPMHKKVLPLLVGLGIIGIITHANQSSISKSFGNISNLPEPSSLKDFKIVESAQ
jgi:hypothetical protein